MEVPGPGATIGHLAIEAELGRGAYGRVYRARDKMIDRLVALKVLPSDDPDGRTRAHILREARAVARIHAPHIVTLYRVHEPQGGSPWMFEMEYLPGGTLGQLLEREGRLAPERAVAVARDIARGLEAAHAAGIVHGDVKPSNVLLAQGGEAKIGDFGLAELGGDASLSMAGALAGTPRYMAPEVVMGERPTTASDVWSFGIVLFEMLEGKQPFAAGNLPTLFYAIQHADPAPLAGAPAALRDLVARCLRKTPGDRPRSFTEILGTLAAFRPERPGAPAAPADTPPAGAEPPLAGRAGEIRLLGEVLRKAAHGEGCSLLIAGPSGIGKTALVRHFESEAATHAIRTIEAGVTRLRGVLRPLLEGLRTALEGDIEPALAGPAADLVRRLLKGDVVLESRAQTLWGFEHLLAATARRHRLALVVEDAHEADEEDLRLLEHLAQHLPRQGSVLLVTARSSAPSESGGAHRLAACPHFRVLELAALTRQETYEHLHRLSGARQVFAEVARHVYAVGEGNPLHTTELYRHLRAHDAVVVRDDALQPGPAWSRIAIPTRLVELCAARLDGLAEEDRALLDIAAADGPLIDGDTIAAVAGLSLLSVLRTLQRIYRHSALVLPKPEGYRFAHALYQEVVYADLAPELRRTVHAAIAGHLEKRRPEAIDPERVGSHWERAGDLARATPYLRRAALLAAQRQEIVRAIDLAERAGFVPGAEAASIAAGTDLAIALSGCYEVAGRHEDAVAMLHKLEEGSSDEGVRMRAFVQRSSIALYRAGAGAVDEEGLRRVAAAASDACTRGLAHYILGVAAKYRNDLDAAEAHLKECDELFHAEADPRHASALDQLATVAFRRGRLGEAWALYEDAARIAASAGRRNDANASRVNSARVAIRRGDLDGLTTKLETCVNDLDLEGSRFLAGHAMVFLARVRLAHGDLPGAEATVNGAIARLRQVRNLAGLLAALTTLAHVSAARGDLDAAEALVREARTLADEAKSQGQQLRLAALGALIATWRGDLAAATRELDLVRDLPAGLPTAPEHLLYVAQACLYGLPAGRLAEARRRMHDDTGEDPFVDAAITFADAVENLHSGDVQASRRSAERLRARPPGEDRAEVLGCVSYLLAATGGPDAAREAEDGLRAASALGHVWLELLFLTLAPGEHRGILEARAAELARRLRDPRSVPLFLGNRVPPAPRSYEGP